MDLARNLIVDRLPKTSTGKIQKNVVRSEHARHYQEG
jgi:acyl-coenzyme A synthetase/AMP-(fatty) acid ligase